MKWEVRFDSPYTTYFEEDHIDKARLPICIQTPFNESGLLD